MDILFNVSRKRGCSRLAVQLIVQKATIHQRRGTAIRCQTKRGERKRKRKVNTASRRVNGSTPDINSSRTRLVITPCLVTLSLPSLWSFSRRIRRFFRSSLFALQWERGARDKKKINRKRTSNVVVIVPFTLVWSVYAAALYWMSVRRANFNARWCISRQTGKTLLLNVVLVIIINVQYQSRH